MTRQQRITALLEEVLKPVRLEVIDESSLHSGHQPGFDGGGETHMRVRITAAAFANMSRVERHRAINDLIGDEFENGLHALVVEAEAP